MKSAIKERKSDTFLYIVITAWVFVISLFVLNFFGFVPYYIDGTPSKEELAQLENSKKEQEEKQKEEQNKPEEQRVVLPTRIIIPAVGIDAPVSNPDTTDIDALDRELLRAVVRYPGSGTLGMDGNMLIFGHSTGYRTVRNQMFKAFNGLQNLEKGNFIKLINGDTEYLYVVNKLRHEKASNVTVDFVTEPGVKQLTLSTCDSFGAKSDRWIVTADFVGSFPVEDMEQTDGDQKGGESGNGDEI